MNVMSLLRKRKGSVFFFFLLIWCFLVIYFQNFSRFSCSYNLPGFGSKDLFLCCLLLINVNTACNLIPEPLLTDTSVDIPAGTALAWTFLKKLNVCIVFHISGVQLQHIHTLQCIWTITLHDITQIHN